MLNFADVVEIYRQSKDTKITRHRISQPALGYFCVSIEQFERLLDDLVTEDYWQQFLLPLKRIRFGLCAAPFSEEYKQMRISDTLTKLRHNIRLCDKLYPNHYEGATAILNHLENLTEELEDPLLSKLIELSPSSMTVAWVIKESRLINDVENVVATLNSDHIDVIHPLQLRNMVSYDRIVVIGPSRWFPESIFTAPRSLDIHIIIFDWIKDRWRPQDTFASPHKSSGPSSKSKMIDNSSSSNKWNELDAESLLVIVNKADTANSIFKQSDFNDYDNIEAVCAFLEGDWVVFIDGSDGANALVIDMDEDPNDRVQRIPVKSIEPGTFILVRTGGGEDYIVPIANKLMGKDAPEIRKHQQYWKQLLRNYVRQHGIFKTSIDLLDLGSGIANEINVRNWMSPRTIRTQKYDDFLAIMKLVGLKNEAKAYWNMMDQINKAHRSAGYKIRDLLFDQIKDLDVNLLHKLGKMDFKLSEDDDGGVTAFRVESILRDTVSVPYSRIGQPFRLESSLWQK